MVSFPEPYLTRFKFEQDLRGPPSRTLEDARKWGDFAVQCVRAVPPGLEGSAWNRVTDRDLREAFGLAEAWLTGRPVTPTAVLRAKNPIARASALTGEGPRTATGEAAAVWAVANAVEAITSASMIGAEPPSMVRTLAAEEDRAVETGMYACVALSCVLNVWAEEHMPAAITCLRSIMQTIWPPKDAGK